MKTLLTSSLLIVLFCSCVFFGEKPLEEPIIKGNLLLGQPHPGESWEVYIDTDFDRGNGFVISNAGTCSDSATIEYIIGNIPLGGPYLLYAFVPTEPVPNNCIGYYGADETGFWEDATYISITAVTTLSDYNITMFEVPCPVIVRAHYTYLPAYAGVFYNAYLDEDTDPRNGFLAHHSVELSASGTIDFGISTGDAGSIYCYILVDVDDNGVYATGDLRGYYGSTDGEPGGATSFLYDCDLELKEFNLYPIP